MAIVGGDYLCVHGGISPALKSLKSVEKIDRFVEVPEDGLICDLLWADPSSNQTETFAKNSFRGCSYRFGYEPLKDILTKTKVKMLVRGHEV